MVDSPGIVVMVTSPETNRIAQFMTVCKGETVGSLTKKLKNKFSIPLKMKCEVFIVYCRRNENLRAGYTDLTNEEEDKDIYEWIEWYQEEYHPFLIDIRVI